MAIISVQDSLHLRLEDTAHEIGFATPGELVDFVLIETLETGGFNDPTVDSDVSASDGTEIKNVEITDSLYEKLKDVVEGTDYEGIENAVHTALIDYSQQSDVVTLDVSTAPSDRDKAAIRENLKNLGYIN